MTKREVSGGRALLRGTAVAVGGFLGAVVGASIAVVRSCEPDYPMLCELGGLFGGAIGLLVGATLAGVLVGIALRGRPMKLTGAVSAAAVLGVGLFLVVLHASYPEAFRNVLVYNLDIWVIGSAVLGMIVGGVAFLLELARRDDRETRSRPGRHLRDEPV